ncbi:hypothetical protein FHU13_000681 [Methylobacterium sp. R2-1]|nr:hypothetical protein [Methylobacterium sp. R2-1]
MHAALRGTIREAAPFRLNPDDGPWVTATAQRGRAGNSR